MGNPEGKILNHKSLNRISDLVDYHIEIYRKKLMSIQQKLVRTASWITIQEQGDNHQLHNHKQSVVSVSFYPQVDSGKLKLSQARLIPAIKVGDEMALTAIFLSSLRLIKEFRD